MPKTFVDFDGQITVETPDAIKVVLSHDDFVWLPKSQIGEITYAEGGDSEEVRIGQDIEAIEVSNWLAEKNGWV